MGSDAAQNVYGSNTGLDEIEVDEKPITLEAEKWYQKQQLIFK